MSGPILSINRLTRFFGGLRALDLSLEVRSNELRCLIGPNGAGKSTFFKILSGGLKPSAGSVRFRDREITRLDAFRIARLGISIKFQVPSLFEQLSVFQNLHLAAENRFGFVEGLKRTLRMLERIGYVEYAHEPVGSLSYGQKQRLEIAVATVAEPNLVLLDEPTAGMSPDEIDRTIEFIEEITKRTTIIVVEHNMDFVRRVSRWVTVMHEGQVFAEGTMAEIETNTDVRDIYLGRRRARRHVEG